MRLRKFEDLVVGNGGAAGSRGGSLVALVSIFLGRKHEGGRGLYGARWHEINAFKTAEFDPELEIYSERISCTGG